MAWPPESLHSCGGEAWVGTCWVPNTALAAIVMFAGRADHREFEPVPPITSIGPTSFGLGAYPQGPPCPVRAEC